MVLGGVGRGGRRTACSLPRRSGWSSTTTRRARRISSPTTSRSTISRASRPGTPDRARHLKDYNDLVAGIDRGDLPQVAFYKPQGSLNEHPGNTDVLSGDVHAAELVARIKASPLWASTVIIFTYDENGGFWDHVAAAQGRPLGAGIAHSRRSSSRRIAKRGYIDHTSYDTTSIIKFITRRFGLEPLPGARAGAGDLTNALDLAP